MTATVVTNGQTFEGAGIRYKGNSTYGANNAKNPLNVALDYTTSQSYDGFQPLKLSSHVQVRSTYMMNVEEFTNMPPTISEIQYL